MGQADEDRYREALEEIVRVATTPDSSVVGTTPGGGVGRLWTVGGQEKALARAIEIAENALATT